MSASSDSVSELGDAQPQKTRGGRVTKNWNGEEALQLFGNIAGLELDKDVQAGDVRWKLLSKKHTVSCYSCC